MSQSHIPRKMQRLESLVDPLALYLVAARLKELQLPVMEPDEMDRLEWPELGLKLI